MKKLHKTPAKPLLLSTEKVRPLDPEQLQHVGGGLGGGLGGGSLVFSNPCSKSYSG
jgi:hypothetical protein